MARLAALPHTTAIVAVRCISLGACGPCPLCFSEAAVAVRVCSSDASPGKMRSLLISCATLPQSAPCADRGGSMQPHEILRSGSCDGAPPNTAPPWSAPSVRDPPRLWRRRTAVCAGGKRRAAATQATVGRGAMPSFGIVRPHGTGDNCRSQPLQYCATFKVQHGRFFELFRVFKSLTISCPLPGCDAVLLSPPLPSPTLPTR